MEKKVNILCLLKKKNSTKLLGHIVTAVATFSMKGYFFTIIFINTRGINDRSS